MRSQVVSLAIPAVGEQLLNMMVGLVDTYLVGHLGASALAAVGISNQLVMLASAIFSAIATACTALVARHTGSREPKLANRILHQSLLLVGSIGMVSTVLGLLYPRQSLVIFQAADDVLDLGEVYLSTVASTFAAMAIMLVGTAALRGVGDTRTPMLIMAVVNVVNMVVAYVLIYGIGPFPALGVLGSALGAAIGRVVGFALVIGVLVRGHRGLRLRSRLLLPDATQFRRIIAIGAPAGAEMLVLRGGMMAFVATVASLGTSALAAHQIALTSESLSFMPGFGFSVAATTLVGQALGARRPRLAERSGWTACGMAALIMSAMGLLFFLFPEKFMAAFTDDPVVIALGSGPLRLVALVQPFLAASMVLSGALRGAGDTRWPLAITASGFWGVRLPLAFILAQTPLGLLGAWTGMAIDLALRGIATTLRFRCGGWTSIQV